MSAVQLAQYSNSQADVAQVSSFAASLNSIAKDQSKVLFDYYFDLLELY